MKFFIDTANIEEIKEAQSFGVLDGVTTNPSLMSRENIKGEKNISYENIPNLCDKFKIKKNLINPIYIS